MLRSPGLRVQCQRATKASRMFHYTITKTCLDMQLVAPRARNSISTKRLRIGWHLCRWLRGEDIAVEEHTTLHTALVVMRQVIMLFHHTALVVVDRYMGQGIAFHHRLHLADHRPAEDVVQCLA